MKGHCILSHGFESGPDATKVTALADMAERLGWTHERPDYSDLDAMHEVSDLGDVPTRLQRLLQIARDAGNVPTSIIHGWHDELIPAVQVVAWAAARDAQLLLVNDSHRLSDHVQASADAFGQLLASVSA
jgi:pimeloyl-ACP methyl ester carboxylesterase